MPFTWPTDTPANRGFDASKLATLASTITRTLPFMDSLLIIRNGHLVYEQYFNDYDADDLHHLASVTKSFASAVVGTAQAQGKLLNLDAKLPELIPSYFANGQHADQREITLRHVLMMRSGLGWDERASNDGGYGDWQTLVNQDLTEWVLRLPQDRVPGASWNYSTADVQVVSSIVQQATGATMKDFAAQSLFASLDIRNFEWAQTNDGATVGGTYLRLAPRDVAKLGQLYLQDGQWRGQQIIASDWVSLTTAPQGPAFNVDSGQTEPIRWYGYLWWLRERGYYDGRSHAIVAYGYGGQYIVILPELDMIVVTMATFEVESGQAAVQEQAVYELVRDTVLRAVQ
jgi:CubicO group peptidase (beta-lactamase class C family)